MSLSLRFQRLLMENGDLQRSLSIRNREPAENNRKEEAVSRPGALIASTRNGRR